MARATGADMKALREKETFSVTEWAKMLDISRQAVYDLEASEQLTPCWHLVYHYMREHGLGILWREKKARG